MDSFYGSSSGPSAPSDHTPFSFLPSDHTLSGRGNLYSLLARREISPRTKHVPKRNWQDPSKRNWGRSLGDPSETARDSKRALLSWIEAVSIRHLSGKYCSIIPFTVWSFVAIAFSPDGRTLASTHVDHTVRIIDWQTGNCIKVLTGHRTTPWVVRFHPQCPEILASGSFDLEVRIWNANTLRCVGFWNFFYPIASICFHAGGDLLAVASGRKLYIWNYIDKTAPTIVLKTRKSVRAAIFPPHAVPLLLTAEVNDLGSLDFSMTCATSLSYLKYPPPAVFVAKFPSADHISVSAARAFSPIFSLPSWDINGLVSRIEKWLMGQSQAGLHSMPSLFGGNREHSAQFSSSSSSHLATQGADPTISSVAIPGFSGRYTEQLRFADLLSVPEARKSSTPFYVYESCNPQPIIDVVQSELDINDPELRCIVNLKVWSYDTTNPYTPLTAERCRLIIPHAVLCSEMCVHFSPCGRFLAACVACTLPQVEADSGLQAQNPISGHEVIYELRIYSLEKSSFGSVLISRPIRAHWLTSIQFSPTSDNILIAYDRLRSPLLNSIVTNGETKLPIFTVVEVYRVADLELVRVLLSTKDEVNMACFHPFAGGGLAYGAREGEIRFFKYDGT